VAEAAEAALADLLQYPEHDEHLPGVMKGKEKRKTASLEGGGPRELGR
jgi:hypothetical protein